MRLQNHYKEVAMSRELEETLRSMPPTAPKPILVLVTDGMDQSHWALPRLKGFRGAKRFSNPQIKRPRAKVHAVWCFYWGVHFFVTDSTQPHDSNLTIEVLSRCLEHCQMVSRKKALPLPTILRGRIRTVPCYCSWHCVRQGACSLRQPSCFIARATRTISWISCLASSVGRSSTMISCKMCKRSGSRSRRSSTDQVSRGIFRELKLR